MRAIPFIILSLIAASCANEQRRIEDKVAELPRVETRLEKEVYTGTYKGSIPCADCDGIEVSLRINEDGSFVLKTKHIVGKHGMEDIHAEYKGGYSWNPDEGTITLSGIESQPNKYLYSDSTLIQLDMNGNRIRGPLAEKYVLKK